MKTMMLAFISVCCFGLMGCASYGGCGGCGGSSCYSCYNYDHDSVCGRYSCTDNTGMDEYSNDCPGPYNCNADP